MNHNIIFRIKEKIEKIYDLYLYLNMLRLISMNNNIYMTNIDTIIKTSKLIKEIVSDDDEILLDDIHLYQVEDDVLDLILKINKLFENNNFDVERLQNDNNYLNYLDSLNNEMFFKLISGVHYLDIEYLENLLCDKFIKLINNKGKDDLEKLFNVKLNI